MKLKESDINIFSDGIISENNYSIDTTDEWIIFEMLRSRIYKNPISSICREIISNARDANREAHNDNPIKISILESNLDNNSTYSICFEDSGIGISESRMNDIFLKYTASTKRNTNTQTGGYGIGAKTPFAYTDTFIIETINNGYKYNYVSFIDETKKGKISLLNKEKTENPSGTKIIVPIKNLQDLQEFKKQSIFYTLFWTKYNPIFINFDFTDKNLNNKIKYLYKENIKDSSNIFSINYAIVEYKIQDNIIILIDEIPYYLNYTDKILFKKEYISSYSSKYVLFLIKFDNGILDVSINREDLQYTNNTINLLNNVYNSLLINNNNIIYDVFINKTQSYIEACYYKSILTSNYNNNDIINKNSELKNNYDFYYNINKFIENNKNNVHLLKYKNKVLLSTFNYTTLQFILVSQNNTLATGISQKYTTSLVISQLYNANIIYLDGNKNIAKLDFIFKNHFKQFILIKKLTYYIDSKLNENDYYKLQDEEFKSLTEDILENNYTNISSYSIQKSNKIYKKSKIVTYIGKSFSNNILNNYNYISQLIPYKFNYDSSNNTLILNNTNKTKVIYYNINNINLYNTIAKDILIILYLLEYYTDYKVIIINNIMKKRLQSLSNCIDFNKINILNIIKNEDLLKLYNNYILYNLYKDYNTFIHNYKEFKFDKKSINILLNEIYNRINIIVNNKSEVLFVNNFKIINKFFEDLKFNFKINNDIKKLIVQFKIILYKYNLIYLLKSYTDYSDLYIKKQINDYIKIIDFYRSKNKIKIKLKKNKSLVKNK